MTIKELIQSAERRIVQLTQAEFTPQAELASLELQLATAKMLYNQTLSTEDYECFA